MATEYLFVYGTLRRKTNSEMSRLLENHAEFIAEASFQGKLYQIDYYPGVISSDDPKDKVLGEVYRLHQADVLLPLLDHYEEVGLEFLEPNEYIRQKQPILLENGDWLTAWVYIYNHPTEGLKLQH